MSEPPRLRRTRAWLFAGALALVQVALAAPPVTHVAEAAKRKTKKAKKKGEQAEPAAGSESESDEILSITSGALGESEGSGGGAASADPEAGLDGPSDAAAHSATPAAPKGGPPPDALAALDKPRLRRVAVPPYVGKSSESLRQAVLEVLTEHTDLEVVGIADLEMVEKRVHLSSREPGSWPRIATELSLYALVVGDGDASRVRVVDTHGRTLGTLVLDPKQRLDMQARARLWPELGRFLSDEGLRQHLVALRRAAAEAVLRGQGEEMVRQRDLADRRAKLREQLLAASTKRAASRLAAQSAELARQSGLAQERIKQQQLAAAKAAEDARQAAIAAQRQQELAAKQQQAAMLAAQQQQQQQAAAPAYAAPAAGYAAPAAAYPAQGAYPAQTAYPPPGAYPAQPAYPPQGAYPAQGAYAAQPAYPVQTGGTYPAQGGYGSPAARPSTGYSNQGGYVPKSQQVAPPAAPPPPSPPPAQ